MAITYARATDHAHDVAADLRKRGRQALTIQAEATDITALRNAVDTAAAAFGRLDILVNNGGIAPS